MFGYIDVDYVGDMDKRRSTLGYVFMFIGGVVSWRSRLQNCTSMSTIEAKYIVVLEACKEAIWLSRLVRDLGITIEMPTLHCDSQSAIMLGKESGISCKDKEYRGEVPFYPGHALRQELASCEGTH